MEVSIPFNKECRRTFLLVILRKCSLPALELSPLVVKTIDVISADAVYPALEIAFRVVLRSLVVDLYPGVLD